MSGVSGTESRCKAPQFYTQEYKWEIFVASRPQQAIRISFDDLLHISTRIALSDEYKVANDIRRFLEDKLAVMRYSYPRKVFMLLDWPSDEDVNELVLLVIWSIESVDALTRRSRR